MKCIRIAVVKSVLCFSTFSAGFVLGAEPDAVVVEPTMGGALVGVDLLAGTDAEGNRTQPWYKAVGSHISRNKWKYIAGVGSAVAVDRVAANNDMLYYSKSKDRDSVPKPVAAGASVGSTSAATQGTSVSVTGNSSPVTVIVYGDTTQISSTTYPDHL